MKRSEFDRDTRGRTRRKEGFVFLVLILVILVGVAVWMLASLRRDTVEETLGSNDRVINTLFVMEGRDGEVLFTDVFIYYPVSRRGALINILGNTGGIYRSLDRVDRIDVIYAEKGIEVYKTEIENLIGQPIPFYVVLKLDTFGALTDMLGGMSVFIPEVVDVKSEAGERWLLPSGIVNLDGSKMNTYLTFSKPDDTEDDVIDRRQNVMVAFFNALGRNRRIVQDRESFAVLSGMFGSNLEEGPLFRLFSEISQVDAERLIPQAITGLQRMASGKMLLFPFYDGDLIKDVVKQAANSLVTAADDAGGGRVYVLEILNGTSQPGLARNTSVLMQSAGYDVLSTGNADSADYEKTTIINHIGNSEVAKNLGDFIRCQNIVDEEVSPDTEANVDFTLVLGRDFDGRYVRSR